MTTKAPTRAADAPSDAQLANAAKTIAAAGADPAPAQPDPGPVANPSPGAATPTSDAAWAHSALAGAIDQIDQVTDSGFDDLRHRLETEQGMTIAEKTKGSGVLVVKMGGVTTESTGGIRIALENWANAARRAALADAPVISGRT